MRWQTCLSITLILEWQWLFLGGIYCHIIRGPVQEDDNVHSHKQEMPESIYDWHRKILAGALVYIPKKCQYFSYIQCFICSLYTTGDSFSIARWTFVSICQRYLPPWCPKFLTCSSYWLKLWLHIDSLEAIKSSNISVEIFKPLYLRPPILPDNTLPLLEMLCCYCCEL